MSCWEMGFVEGIVIVIVTVINLITFPNPESAGPMHILLPQTLIFILKPDPLFSPLNFLTNPTSHS